MKPEHRAALMEMGEEMLKQGCNGFELVVRDRGEAILVIDILRLKHADL